MERRDFLALGASTLMGSMAFAENDHSKHTAPRAKNKKLAKVVKSLEECLTTGEECLSHCLYLIRQGDTSIAQCASSVTDLLSICRATREVCVQEFATQERILALTQLCANFCKDCAAACEPHVKHHKECKECFNACNDCAKACQALA